MEVLGLSRLWRGLFYTRDWRIAVFPHSSLSDVLQGCADTDYFELRPLRSWRYFWADPHVARIDGKVTHLYVEQFDRLIGRGEIRYLKIEGRQVVEETVVLTGLHHYSFPQTLRIDDQWFAVVESCENPMAIYHFDEHGEPWRASPESALPAILVDPQLAQFNGKIIIVGNDALKLKADQLEVVSTRAGALGGWSSEEIFEGRFGSLRSGGRLDLDRGMRAVQSDSVVYGLEVGIFNFSQSIEKPVEWFDSEKLFNATGMHTVSWFDSDLSPVVFDCWHRKFTPIGWLFKLTDLAHRKRCIRRTLKSTGKH